MTRAPAFTAILSAVIGACSLTTDLDGFTNGPKDAGPNPADVGTSSSLDGMAPPGVDGSTAMDSGTDGGAPASCPQKPVSICEEFDADEKKNGWLVAQTGGASIGPATAPWGEHGLLVTIPKADTGDLPNAYWEKRFQATISKFSFDVDLEFDQIPTNVGEYHNVVGVRIDHGNTYNVVYLTIGTASIGYAVQDFPAHDGDIDYRGITLAPGARHHLHFEAAVGGASRIVIDGTTQADNPTPAFFQAGQPTTAVGITLSGLPTTSMAIGYGHLIFTGE